MAGQFRSYVWDPALIISQIACMQCIFYGGIGFWLLLLDTIIGRYVTVDQMFFYQEMQFKDGFGKLVMIANVLGSLSCAVGLWYVVQRTKQCLDFTVTMHVFHVFISWFVNSSFPGPLSWWLTCLVCVIITTLLGEFLCMRTEMKSIPVGSCAKADL